MSDTVGWRWSQNIVGFIFAFVLIAFTFTFEETLFPRFLFAGLQAAPLPSQKDEETAEESTEGKRLELRPVPSQANGMIDDFPKRSYQQILKPWVRFPQNKTTFWQYFRRPFFLWGFPNVIIVGISSTPHYPSLINKPRPRSSMPSGPPPVSSLSTLYPRS
jgi:hypothetical protein